MTCTDRRVLITRTHGAAGVFAQELASCSGRLAPVELIYAPVHEAELYQGAKAEREAFLGKNFRWVTFTSANGVLAAEAVLHQPLSQFLASLKVACVGKATARALEGRGVKVDFIPTVSDAAHLASELPETAADHANRAVLCVQGTNARTTLTKGLTSAGWEVTPWNVYTMSPYPCQNPLNTREADAELTNVRIDQAVEELPSVRAVVATAPSLLTGLYESWRLAQKEPDTEFPLVIAIGATTARTAEQLGLRVVQSPTPSPSDLAQTTIDSIEKEDNAS